MKNPLDVFETLRDYFFRYYNTPFSLLDEGIERERHERLDQDGVTWREPWIEALEDFEPSPRDIPQSLATVGAPPGLAEFTAAGLLSGIDRLYAHQERALAAAVAEGKNVVLTAGTGSGKTEAFLLPILSDLIAESNGWPGPPADPARTCWWRDQGGEFTEQRQGEPRQSAVRTLILYPMNALVEDQLVRLRHALDGWPARRWLDSHRGGHRFYFGRYTGLTPVPGRPTSDAAIRRLVRHLTDADGRAARAQQADEQSGTEHQRFYIPRLDGAEMRSRWDMQAHPPDVLITNYSMLNVMLMRGIEETIFAQTREWLETDPSHVLTIVVDELHTYRGTQGSEVAYLLRNLLHRLGLAHRPDQVRFIAASASIDDTLGPAFLEGFFGAPADSFEIIRARTVGAETRTRDLSGHLDAYAGGARDGFSPRDASQLLSRTRGGDALSNACVRDGARTARPVRGLAQELFPNGNPDRQAEALRGLLDAVVSADDQSLPRVRAHLLFRNVQGVWACSDPDCTAVPDRFRNAGRRVGRLYSQPAHVCDCGSRVLELLYCQTCGEAFLGGYRAPDPLSDGALQHVLFADIPQLEAVPSGQPTSGQQPTICCTGPRTASPSTGNGGAAPTSSVSGAAATTRRGAP
jgi:ATP-dependent helicase YprA (DUF1998 family)